MAAWSDLLLVDLTYPVTAYTTGHEFNRGIYKSFYHLHIEDFWLPYFAGKCSLISWEYTRVLINSELSVTTNITWSRMETHTSGFGEFTFCNLVLEFKS